MKTILVLFGGRSTEHPVSLQSAHAVLQAMAPSGFTPLPVGITREGQWLWYPGPSAAVADGSWEADSRCIPCTLSLRWGERQLLLETGERLPFDAAFPVLHGKNGEDGTVQGLLELIGAPLIGCGALSSALCMDKDRSHKLAALAGVPCPRSILFRRGAGETELAAAAADLGYPLFVKPVRAGSSFGVSRVTEQAQLPAAAAEAFRHDGEILLEEAADGFEVGCAVLGSRDLLVGAVDEIQLSGGFFDYEEKYTLKTSAIHCPARIPPETAARVQAAARTVYRALGCRCFARVDFFLTRRGELLFNEVNTIPGFTAHSRYPTMMAAAGWDFAALVERIIQLGVEA